MDVNVIRQGSVATAKALKYPVNSSLPVLDVPQGLRGLGETVDRILCLNVSIACAFGYSQELAEKWIDQEGLHETLVKSESKFIYESFGYPPKFWDSIEALWAMVWSIGLVDVLEYGKPCSNDLVTMLPNLKTLESSSDFRSRAKLRPMSEILPALDLAYCLHWSVRDAQLRNVKIPGKVKPHVITERRKALEWLISEESWDEVQLDT